MTQHLYFNWSSGKDSALALQQLLSDGQYNVGKLLVSMNAHYNRVTMHGIRRELLEKQLQVISLPANTLELPKEPTHAEYQLLMNKEVQTLKQNGFDYAGFGDIFLDDLRKYRETNLALMGIEAVFPIWGNDTRLLLKRFIEEGFKAVTVCVDENLLGEHFLGREVDIDFLNELPPNVDPCGENGEFHTFCYKAPFFSSPVLFTKGEVKLETYHYNGANSSFRFLDLLPL